MTDGALLYVAMGVFGLLVTGLFLTAREFTRLTQDPSVRKDSRNASDTPDA